MSTTPAPRSTRFLINADWEDAPHLSDEDKARLLSSIQPAHREARTKGIPSIGAGVIYPVAESDVKVKDFELPKHWPRAYGMDAGGGAKPTAAAWGALDRESQTLYVYSVYKRAAAEPVIHADAVKARGTWIPGVGDCSALIMTREDAEQLIQVYRTLGLDLELPDKGVETGIQRVWERLSAGRLKVFASCMAWFDEYRIYRRDEKGRIVKSNDHLMDATRYLEVSGLERAKVQPAKETYGLPDVSPGEHGWMR